MKEEKRSRKFQQAPKDFQSHDPLSLCNDSDLPKSSQRVPRELPRSFLRARMEFGETRGPRNALAGPIDRKCWNASELLRTILELWRPLDRRGPAKRAPRGTQRVPKSRSINLCSDFGVPKSSQRTPRELPRSFLRATMEFGAAQGSS